MARAHGKDTYFAIDDSGGTLRNISPHVNNVSGLPGARQLSEVTAFGDAGVKNIPGLVNVSFTISGPYDSQATTGSYAVLNGLRSTTTTSSFEYGPASNSSGAPKLYGEAWLSELSIDASVADAITYSATIQVDGVVSSTSF